MSIPNQEFHHGLLGFIAGVTPVIDKHHGVMAILGPRFLQLRLIQPDRHQAGLRAMENIERDDTRIRRALQQRVQAFIASLPTTAPSISASRKRDLAEIAEFVTRARSAVERDPYTRDVAYTPTPEMPPRFARQLLSLAHGVALVSGHAEVSDQDVQRVVRVGLDGIPPDRRACLEYLASAPGPVAAGDAATELSCSQSHARRTLQDLGVLGLTTTSPTTQPDTGRWQLRREYRFLATRWMDRTKRGSRSSRVSDRQAPTQPSQNTLALLRALGEGNMPMQLQDLRKRTGLSRRTCQRTASRTVLDGYAVKPGGRRGLYQLTAAGRSLFAQRGDRVQPQTDSTSQEADA